MTRLPLTLILLTFVASPGAASAAEVRGSVVGPARPTVVALQHQGGPSPLPPGPRVVMDQKNLAFVPPVLPVLRGTMVEFSNGDDVQHNVFSPSPSADKFDLGTYGPGATRTVTFAEVGDVLVLCNIHMEMEAHILVLDTPYFATAAPDGTYRIADVPAGVYEARVWQGRWTTSTRTIEVPADGSVDLDFEGGR